MIDGTEIVVGPRDATKNQIMQLINQQVGGWPARAGFVYMFESKDKNETVYRFAGGLHISLEKSKHTACRRFEEPDWRMVLTRDEYLLKHMSREGFAVLKKEAKDEVLSRIRFM